MKLPTDLNPREAKRRVVAKIAAPVVALLVLVICMTAPLITFAFVSEVPLDAEMPDKGGWLLVAGGGLGAGAAYLTLRTLLLRLGGFKSHEIDVIWHGERKNT